MSVQVGSIRLFFEKVLEVYERHDLHIDKNLLAFSNAAMQKAISGDWSLCVSDLRDHLAFTLKHTLSAAHSFERSPYIRDIRLPEGKAIRVAIINQQSKEWYGSEHAIGSFDFVLEAQRGVFKNCYTFLDLGGHQLVWATYYALTGNRASVKSFEPSILNAVIGLFNCLINGVIDRVDVIPFAVSVSTSTVELNDSDKMLVDFMTIPLKTCHLGEFINGSMDFVKTDIEGYEYELLGDEKFVQLIKGSKSSHFELHLGHLVKRGRPKSWGSASSFELHLGHLVKRGVSLEDSVYALKSAKLNGIELYSQKEMYDFLQTCDRNGFYSFLIS